MNCIPENQVFSIWCRETWGFVIKHLSEKSLKGHLFKSLSKANMPGGAGILYHGLQFYLVLQIIAMFSVILTWNM